MPMIVLLALGVAVLLLYDRAARAVEAGERGRLARALLEWRSRRRWVPAFPLFYVFVLVLMLTWLAAGLAPSLARAVPALHETLHRWGGTPSPQAVTASEVAFDRAELTLAPAAQSVLTFSIDGNAPHNLAIYRDGTANEALFVGEVLRPTLREDEGYQYYAAGPVVYRFGTPSEGTYFFRCDVHPTTMTGIVTVSGEAGRAGGAPLADLWRRVAEASHGAEGGAQVALDYAFSLLSLALGIGLFVARPRDRVARFFALGMVGTAAAYNLQSHAALFVIPDLAETVHFTLVHPLSGIGYLAAVLLFPDGDVVPRWRDRRLRIAYRFAIGMAVLAAIGAAGLLEPGDHTVALAETFGLLVPVAGLLAQGYRARRAPDPDRRRQSRLLFAALLPALAAGIAFAAVRTETFGGVVGPLTVRPSVEFRVLQAVFALIPIAIVIGILRYRLWDIDVVVSKTLVYGSLAAFIGAVYVAVVVGAGQALGAAGGPNTGLVIVAAVIVAPAFDPLRRRFERIANRLVYGERATPYEVLARFSLRLSDALSVEDVLPAMAEAAVLGVNAERARVRLFLPGGGERSAAWPPAGPAGAFDRAIPIEHQGETLGELAVAKDPDDPLTAADNAVLAGLAAQAGLALRNVRLAVELRERLDELQAQAAEIDASRQRIVNARAEELSRTERAISERVGRRLRAAETALGRAEQALGEAGRATALLDEVGENATAALDALRDVVRGIFPPVLVDRGIGPALEARARRAAGPVRVEEALRGARFDPHAEAAVYFCCAEALENVQRHARAQQTAVRVGVDDGWIAFEVADDGTGFDPSSVARSGLQTMRDRVEALGGGLDVRSAPGAGTTVAGRVPAAPAVEAAPS